MRNNEPTDVTVGIHEIDGKPYATMPMEVFSTLFALALQGMEVTGGDNAKLVIKGRFKVPKSGSLDVASLTEKFQAFIAESYTAADQSDDDEDGADRAAYLDARARDEEVLPHAVVKRLAAGQHPLKVFREYRGLTQAELAERAGTKPAYLSQIETGKRDGGRKLLGRLARALEVELADLMVV